MARCAAAGSRSAAWRAAIRGRASATTPCPARRTEGAGPAQPVARHRPVGGDPVRVPGALPAARTAAAGAAGRGGRDSVPPAPRTAPAPAGAAPGAVPGAESAAPAAPRLPIGGREGDRLRGSIALAGGRIDDLVLSDYKETTEPDSGDIRLFSPAGSASPYYAEFGWAGGDAEANALTHAARRAVDGRPLRPHPRPAGDADMDRRRRGRSARTAAFRTHARPRRRLHVHRHAERREHRPAPGDAVPPTA